MIEATISTISYTEFLRHDRRVRAVLAELPRQELTVTDSIGELIESGGCLTIEPRVGRILSSETHAKLTAIYAALHDKARFTLIVSNQWADCHSVATGCRMWLRTMGVRFRNGRNGQIHVGDNRIRVAPVHDLEWYVRGKPDLVFINAAKTWSVDDVPEPYGQQIRRVLSGDAPRIPRLIIVE